MSDSRALKQARWALLPFWLKILSWIGLVFLLAPLFMLLCLVSPPVSFEAHLLGLNTEGQGPPFTPLALAIDVVLFLHGMAALGLLSCRAWGPDLAIVVCGVDLIISLYTYIGGGAATVPVAPAVLAIALVSLAGVRRRWGEVGRSGPAVA